MQFEAKEPAHRGSSSLRQAIKNFVMKNPFVVTHFQCRAVYERNAAYFPHPRAPEKEQHWHERSWNQSHETRIGNQIGKIFFVMTHQRIDVKMFKIFCSV